MTLYRVTMDSPSVSVLFVKRHNDCNICLKKWPIKNGHNTNEFFYMQSTWTLLHVALGWALMFYRNCKTLIQFYRNCKTLIQTVSGREAETSGRKRGDKK